jgi:hypothetical protein
LLLTTNERSYFVLFVVLNAPLVIFAVFFVMFPAMVVFVIFFALLELLICADTELTYSALAMAAVNNIAATNAKTVV